MPNTVQKQEQINSIYKINAGIGLYPKMKTDPHWLTSWYWQSSNEGRPTGIYAIVEWINLDFENTDVLQLGFQTPAHAGGVLGH